MSRVVGALSLLLVTVSVVAIPPPMPIDRSGVVLDSLTGQPLNEVEILAVLIGEKSNVCEADSLFTWTNHEGEYSLKFGCWREFTFKKSGYVSRTLKWPQDLDPPGCSCCADLRTVKLMRVDD